MEPIIDGASAPQVVAPQEQPADSLMEVDNSVVSVDDHDAFASRHMSDLGEEVDDFRVFRWAIKDYHTLDKRTHSPEFHCGGHIWNILLFPQGNAQATDQLSVYLNYANSKAPEGWHVCAQFVLAISNPNDPTIYIQNQAHHRFTNEEQDWGFTRFVELRKLMNVCEGRSKAIIDNDETVVTAFVRVLKDPTGVLWHNFQNYDSKKETGFVGLKNQGATCYMNSLLQSLFLTNAFRRAVYLVPTSEEQADTVPLALQRVFYNLQTSDAPVGTIELTRSFGWRGVEAFLQHDVQEFNRVLQEKLEDKMKGTAADGEVQRLFCGKMKSYIKCIDVDFESSRTEDFYDIQLNVKGLKGLADSFKDYIQVETLDGENKYDAGKLGLQDAKKGVIFESFPPVLHLQLKRFEYDMHRDQNVKINDRHEFPMDIDLADYLDESASREEPWTYQLHGVLVHSGDVHGGHYYTFIKPSPEGRWLKFDDDRVVHVLDREVLEDNFGGDLVGVNGPKPGVKSPMKRFMNAYMLVYIRKSRLDDILRPLPVEQVPEHLRDRLDRERREAEIKRRERDEQHKYLNVKLITDQTFAQHQGFDLATFDDRTMPVSNLPNYKVLKTQPFVDFRAQIAKEYNLGLDQMRLWVLVNRQNKTIRPDGPVPDNDPTMTMELVRDKLATRQSDLKLYLEHVDAAACAKWFQNHGRDSPITIFVKHFDVTRQTLAGVGHFYVHPSMKVSDLATMINERMGYPAATPLKIYEEIKPNMIELMKMKATFTQCEIQDGDIVCFQVDMSEPEMQDLDRQSMFTNPVQFYDFFVNRVVVRFRPKFENQDGKEEFELTLSKKDNYERLSTRVGEYLKHDPLKLRFTQSNGQNGQPKQIVRRTPNITLADLLQTSYMSHASNLLYYELLEVSIVELETKKNLKITWIGPTNKEEGSHAFLLPKQATITDVAQDWLRKMITLSNDASPTIRMFQITDGRRQHIFNGNETMRDFPDSAELYAEQVPMDESRADENVKIVPVFHYSREPTRTHGIPFSFTLKPGETFAETKKRLQQRSGTTDRDMAKMKFALLTGNFTKPTPITDEDVLYEHKWADGQDFIGLDHPDKTIKRSEKALFIR